MIDASIIPANLKLINTVSVFKKGSKNLKKHYWLAIIIPNISKIYERFLFSQMTSYFEKVLSKCQ